MRMFSLLLIIAMIFAPLSQSFAAGGGFAGEKFTHTIYVKGTTTGGSGQSYRSPKPFVDGDLWAIPANVVIEKVYVIIDTAITGTTVMEVGDDDDPDGFCTDAVLAAGFGTPAMYGYSAKVAGAYLRTETAGGTDAADIDVVPNAKYYSATGKEVKLNVTTANTAGEARVVIEGYRLK